MVCLHFMLTGCDTTSQFTGIGKNTSWKVFQLCLQLLHNFGDDLVPSPATISLAEQFVCKLYDPKTASKSTHEVRCALFRKLKANVDTLPPTSALTLHIMRAHYQTRVWKQSLVTHPQLPSPINCGWHVVEGRLVPKFSTEEPLQARCLLTVCGCKESGKQSNTRRCVCQKKGLIAVEHVDVPVQLGAKTQLTMKTLTMKK